MTAEQNGAMPQENGAELLDYLMRRFGSQVIKLAYYHVRDMHLAEDIMQEVFCRVYKNLEKFRKDSSYYTWIYRITVNLCKDYKQSAYFRRTLLWHTDREAEDDARSFEIVEGGEVFARVMDLPEKLRTVVALHYFEDMSTIEIARVLKISENAARTRLFRGRKLLKQALEDLT